MPGGGRVTSSSDSHVSLENEHVYERMGHPTRRTQKSVGHIVKFSRKHFVFSICLSLFAIVLSSVVLVRMLIVERCRSEGSTCLSCALLVSTPVIDEDPRIKTLRRHVVNGKVQCCAETPEHFVTMVKMIHDRRSKQLKVTETTRTERAPRLQLPEESTVAGHLLSRAHGKHGHNFLKRGSYISGIKIHKDRVIIETKGLYYVYSQVYFKVLVGNGEEKPHILGHQVHRYSVHLPNDGDERLLQSVHTCAEDTNNHLYLHTSYVGGIFHLHRGTELYVRVSHPSLINHDRKFSFFGVFKIGS